MANRVTGAEVKEIINTSLTAEQISAFITAANTLVNNKLASSGLTAATKKEIERWLAAHFVYIRDPKLLRESIDDASETRDVPRAEKGENMLARTPYGQQAIMLDISGTLASLGKRAAKIECIYESDDSSST